MRKASLLFSLLLIGAIVLDCSLLSRIHNIRDTGSSIEKDRGSNLTLMTFNIRVGAGIKSYGKPPHLLTPSKVALQEIVDAIGNVDPDVVALQEVSGFQQAKYLAEALNLNYAYISHGNPYFHWGLAVLSKLTILEVHRGAIYYGRHARRSLMCRVEKDGESISVVNVHYHLGSYESQVSATLKLLTEIEGPLILMGDFNRRPWDYELEPIQKLLIDTCEAVDSENAKKVCRRGTWFYSRKRIDYIFVNAESFQVNDVGLALEHSRASDHIAFFAHVSLRN